MAPSTSSISSQLRLHIYYQLDNQLLQNALFLAERLVAMDHRSAESSYMLSLCHLRLGDYRSAYEYSKPAGLRGTHPGCAYVFALASLALERYKDGIVALEKSRGLWGGRNSFGKHTQSSRCPYPDAAAVYCLLGKLCLGYEDKKKAISYFEEALKMNPFMWDAFTSLCNMGVNVRVSNIFRVSSEIAAIMKSNQVENPSFTSDRSQQSSFSEPMQSKGGRPPLVIPEEGDPFDSGSSRPNTGGLFGSFGLSQKINESIPHTSGLPAAGGGGIAVEDIATPTGPSAIIDTTIVSTMREPGVVSAYAIEPPSAPQRTNRTLLGIGMDFSMGAHRMGRAVSARRLLKTDQSSESLLEGATSNRSAFPPQVPERKRTISGQTVTRQQQGEDQVRRSTRLSSQRPAISRKEPSATATIGPSLGRELKKARPPISRLMRPGAGSSTVGRVVSGNRKAMGSSEDVMDVDSKESRPQSQQSSNNGMVPMKSLQPLESEYGKQEEALRWILELFKKLGSGYYALSQFRSQEALQQFGALPRAQQETPWVLAQIGRAHYEQASYQDAEAYYRKIRTVAPTRLEDMEVYSTILWHLKRETDLSFLAHELIDADWHSPYAWCALGNAWSLARDHEQALRCFKRATQLNPKFAYAFTLQGHEHVANEEYDKALTAYRQAIAADKRHYNAYYGLGRVFEKLGNHDKAFVHFSAASAINPTNAVLICCIGTVLEKQKKHRPALQYFTKATELAPRSALTRFKKARALMAIQEYEIALAELMLLKDIAPDEAMVHFLLAKLYKILREKGLAVRHFTIALNLDPKASQEIKAAIESLEHEDVDDDDPSMMA